MIATESIPATGGELQGMLRDYLQVTQRLAETHEALQREVLRLRCELESKDRELERRRRLASLGELAAGVAHEVRNPLGAIQLYSGLLKTQCRNAQSAVALIEKIEAGIRAIDGVVQDTLALAPRGCRMCERPVAELIERAADTCRALLERHGVTLEIDDQNAGLSVLADSGALQRVLVNLIANAAEASPAGATVTLRAERGDGVAVLRVLDNGPGLSAELLDRVFDPFFTTKEQGTGLGLSIAHRLVEAHGGALTVRNRPAGGAEFIVTLPTGADAGRPAADAHAA